MWSLNQIFFNLFHICKKYQPLTNFISVSEVYQDSDNFAASALLCFSLLITWCYCNQVITAWSIWTHDSTEERNKSQTHWRLKCTMFRINTGILITPQFCLSFQQEWVHIVIFLFPLQKNTFHKIKCTHVQGVSLLCCQKIFSTHKTTSTTTITKDSA